MSANIPDTMLLSDLLKPTGYARCLAVSDSPSVSAPYVQQIQSVTSDELSVDENYRESFSEVTENVVLAALGA